MSYKPTIGIECHVQLKTKTKLFAAVANDAREAPPNTLISHICLGMPGALPVLNEAALDLAMKAAFALNTEPQHFSNFDRKHYFYPDLPKGYQISQFNHPIIVGGYVQIELKGKTKKIGVTRAHMEEDAGKSTHPAGKDYSLVDLNRAGTPLLEIVSEPDISSSAEAKAYAHELYLLMRYAEVSEANLYYGNMRFDVNVSVSKDPNKLGIRTETKNLNSFKAVEKAVDYELKRQTEVLQKGGTIDQETRGWDESKQKTFIQRTKEDAHDYRYFPDPDIPPVVLQKTDIEEVKKTVPVMPAVIREKLHGLNLDSSTIETIIEEMPAARLIIKCLNNSPEKETARKVALWLAGDIQALVTKENVAWVDLHLNADKMLALGDLTLQGKVSSTGAKAVLIEMVKNGGEPVAIADRMDVLQVSGEQDIQQIVEQVIKENSKAAEDIKNGESKAVGFLVGQVMKQSKGKANPAVAQKLIKELLQ